MPEFTYVARDRTGRPVEGSVVADNSAIALGKIKAMGYEVEKVRAVVAVIRKVSIRRRFAENFLYPVVSGVPLKDLAIFYRQFATMIDAGIPLFQSLATLEHQTKNPKMQEIIRACQQQVQVGGKLSDVFAGYPWVFSDLQIEMIRAAEHGGMLDKMLQRIADYIEQELALRRLISGLTIYPKIVVFSALMILGKSFFTDFTPAVSKLVLGGMGKSSYTGLDYLFDTVFFLGAIALILFGIVAFCRIFLFQSAAGREGYERFKMAIPGLGKVIKQFALAKFGRAFAAMYAGGLPLNQAVRVAGNASGSKLVARAVERGMLVTEKGGSISEGFRSTGMFPPIVLDMLHTGEQTGNVDAMMNKTAEYLEGDAEAKARQYSHLFATGVYLLVAILVGFAIISFWGGIAGTYGAAGE